MIINDVLDFSKIEAGKLELEFAEFDLPSLVEECVGLLDLSSKTNGLKTNVLDLRVSIGEGVPDCVVGDPARIRQILLNLLSNALKFTQDGYIELRLTVREFLGETCQIAFSVEDTGIGMPPDVLQRLFQSFWQADSSTTRRFGGTGLGLAITKRLVEITGGTIGVESVAGEGSTFGFVLDFRVAAATAADSLRRRLDGKPVLVVDDFREQRLIVRRYLEWAGAVVSEAASGKDAMFADEEATSLHILLAEDHQPNQVVVKLMLRNLKCRIDVAVNGLAAIEACAQRSYDLILMDCQMPEMDGFNAAGKFAATALTRRR